MATRTELYRFAEQGSVTVWAYTSGNEMVPYNGDDYIPHKIKRSDAEVKNEMPKSNIEVTVPLGTAPAMKWLRDNGELLVSLTIFEREKGGAFNVVWKGRLVGVIPGMENVVLRFESIFTSLRRPGLRARYQRSCRHALYGRGCGLDPETFAVVGECTAAAGTVLTVTEAALQPNGYYTGGMLRSPDGVLSYIIAHSGTLITLQRLSASLADAMDGGFPVAVTLYPGCSHDRATCSAKFANLDNYGGFDFIPQKNPTGGSSIV